MILLRELLQYIINHMERILTYLGAGLLPLSGGLFLLWGYLQYEWFMSCLAKVVLVFAFISLVAAIGCFTKAIMLARKREDFEKRIA